MRAVLAAAAVAVALVVGYLAAGGGDLQPTAPPDPCTRRAPATGGGAAGAVERIALEALTGSACELRVSRETLLLALTGDRRLDVDRRVRDAALRSGLRRAINVERRAGRLGATEAAFLSQAVDALPIDVILDRLLGGR